MVKNIPHREEKLGKAVNTKPWLKDVKIMTKNSIDLYIVAAGSNTELYAEKDITPDKLSISIMADSFMINHNFFDVQIRRFNTSLTRLVIYVKRDKATPLHCTQHRYRAN